MQEIPSNEFFRFYLKLFDFIFITTVPIVESDPAFLN